MEALREAGVTIKLSKFQWGKKYWDFLGHLIGCGQLVVSEHRFRGSRDS